MKKTLIAMLLGAATLASAQINSYNYSWNPTNAIADGNPVGLTHQFVVSEATQGVMYDVQVSLDITGGFNGDLYAYLISPQGWTAVLLNRVGVTDGNPLGYSDAGFNITLDGLASDNVHFYQTVSNPDGGQLTGTWAADGRNINPNSSGTVFDSASTAASLGQYAGYNANGTWTLFIADLSGGGGSATLNQTILTIMTVPEPQTWAMLGGGLGMLLMFRRRK